MIFKITLGADIVQFSYSIYPFVPLHYEDLQPNWAGELCAAKFIKWKMISQVQLSSALMCCIYYKYR